MSTDRSLPVPIINAEARIHGGFYIRDQYDIRVGDRVRSFDFERRYDCYMDGILVEVGYFSHTPGVLMYKILVMKDVKGSEIRHVTGLMYAFVPKNGTEKASGGTCQYVIRIG